jgi:membrane protein implicated in regulation of membrane protease activity
LNVTAAAAFTGLTVAVALRAGWWWPFAVILGVTGLSYLAGLAAYSIAEERPEAGSDPQYRASPPSTPGRSTWSSSTSMRTR